MGYPGEGFCFLSTLIKVIFPFSFPSLFRMSFLVLAFRAILMRFCPRAPTAKFLFFPNWPPSFFFFRLIFFFPSPIQVPSLGSTFIQKHFGCFVPLCVSVRKDRLTCDLLVLNVVITNAFISSFPRFSAKNELLKVDFRSVGARLWTVGVAPLVFLCCFVVECFWAFFSLVQPLCLYSILWF